MTDQRLLKLRNEKKRKKPHFIRQSSRRIKFRGEEKWRQPKGMHSKLRKKLRGKIKQPSLGYSSPSDVKGLNRDGFREVLVRKISDLEKIDSKNETVVICKTGAKNKVNILKKCVEKKLKVMNVKNIEEFIKRVEEKLASKKKIGKEREEKKQKATKKKEEVKKEEEQKDEVEETKKGEKSEKIKVLEKRA